MAAWIARWSCMKSMPAGTTIRRQIGGFDHFSVIFS